LANLDFSVPYNDDPETLNEIFRLKKLGDNSIKEVYLSGPQEYSGSGRTMGRLEMDQFLDAVRKIHKEGIRVNLLMNVTCEGSDWYSPEVVIPKMEYLRQVHKEHGVEAVTIANPIYIKEVRRRFPDIEICASVLSEIDCVQRAILIKEAGANVITPDMNINRNLRLLKDIKEATGTELKLMVNEGCLYKCPFRKFHFNYTSHKSKEVASELGIFFETCCVPATARDPSQVLKSGWIRPEDISKYGEITNYFKIVGRSLSKSKIVRCIKAYMQESWDGGLLDIMCDSFYCFNQIYGAYLDNKSLDKYGFFEKVTSCDKDCYRCSYCENLAKKLFRFRFFTQEEQEDIVSMGRVT
jgi:collagenase-like PrtC family protease